MSHYFLHYKGRAAVLDVPSYLSSDGWGKLQKDFSRVCVPKHRDELLWVDCFRLWPDQALGPVFWDEELAGPDGASFLLLPMPPATEDDVKAARNKLYRDRDVVRMAVRQPTYWLPLESIRYQIDPQVAIDKSYA